MGKVSDDDGIPITMASVILYPDSLGKLPMEAFAMTDRQGAFALNAPQCFSGWLFVRCMGYEEHVEKFLPEKLSYVITLPKKTQELHEVLVKGHYSGVKARGDSIIFDVNHFKTGAEENISDVLRRLPGMEVSETGKVKYEGKNVDKILINGGDVMQTGSGIMINGLPADVVEGAEILRNWSDGSMANSLRGIEQQTALNIKTHEKLRCTGKIEGGGGFIGKYQAKSTSMLIGKNGSLTAAISSNNLGKEILSLEDYVSSFIDLKGLSSSNGISQKELSAEESAMLTPPSNVYKNANSAVVLNGDYNVSSKIEAKVGVILNRSDMSAFDRSNVVYYNPSFITESEDSTDKTNETESVNLRLRWCPIKNLELQSVTFGKWSDYKTNQDIGYFGSNEMQVSDHEKIVKSDFTQSLQITSKLGITSLYTLMSLGKGTQTDRLSVTNDSLLLPSYNTFGTDLFGIKAYTSSSNSSLGFEVGSKWAIAKGYNLAAALRTDRIKNELSSEDSYYETNHASNKYNKLSASLIFEKTLGLLRFSADASLTDNRYTFGQSGMNANSLRFNYNSSLRLVFSSKSELIMTGKRETSQISLNRMAGFPIHLAYNRVQTSSEVRSPFANKDVFSAYYRLRNSYSNFLLFVSAMYSNTNGNGLANVTQQGVANHITYTDGGRERWMSLHSVISKGLGHLPADAKIKLSWTRSSMDASLNNNRFNTIVQSPKVELSLTTRRNNPFNFELGASYTGKNYTSYADHKQSSDLWTTYAYAYLAMGKFKGTLKYEFSDISGDKLSRINHNIGFSLSYKLKSFLLTLSSEELLHLHNNDWMEVYSSAYSSSVSYYRRMPGYILLSLSWNF